MAEFGPSGESKHAGISWDHVRITHSDSRRDIVEFYNQKSPTFGNARLIRIPPPEMGKEIILVGHFHSDSELLFVLSGEITRLKLQNVDIEDYFELTNLGEDTKIFLPPRIAHELVFCGRATLIALSEDIYTPGKLIQHPIISPHL